MERTSTAEMTRLEWLQARRAGIGGSDAPALILPPDAYKWKRPIDVYRSKIEAPDDAESPLACRIGTFLEPFVAQLFAEATGQKVHNINAILRSDKYPFAFANIDRKLTGIHEGLECKTTSAYRARQFTDDEYPIEYYVQIQHYLAVTGWKRWHLGVLIGNFAFRHYVVERNEDDIAQIMAREGAFWELVKTKNQKELEENEQWL